MIALSKLTRKGHRMETASFALALFLLVMLAAAGLYDIVVIRYFDNTMTISYVIRTWSFRWPVILLFVGMLLWHLFGINGVEKVTIEVKNPPVAIPSKPEGSQRSP